MRWRIKSVIDLFLANQKSTASDPLFYFQFSHATRIIAYCVPFGRILLQFKPLGKLYIYLGTIIPHQLNSVIWIQLNYVVHRFVCSTTSKCQPQSVPFFLPRTTHFLNSKNFDWSHFDWFHSLNPQTAAAQRHCARIHANTLKSDGSMRKTLFTEWRSRNGFHFRW